MGAGICDNFVAALRGWPIRDIERSVRLSEPQRVAFYDLVSSSLKAADTLAGACPPENALTPLRSSDADARAPFNGARSDDSDTARLHPILRCSRPGPKGTLCRNAIIFEGVKLDALRDVDVRPNGKRFYLPKAKQASRRKSRKEVAPTLGLIGVSLSLAGGASAATAVDPATNLPFKDTATGPGVMLTEEEISDVSLGTFYVFDKESAGRPGANNMPSAGAEAAGAAEGAGAAEAAGAAGVAAAAVAVSRRGPLQIIEESFQPGETVSSVARRRGVAPNLLYRWRRLMTEGGAAAMNQLSGARRSAGSKSASVSLSGCSAANGRLWRSRSQKNRACGSCRSRRTLPDEGGRRCTRGRSFASS